MVHATWILQHVATFSNVVVLVGVPSSQEVFFIFKFTGGLFVFLLEHFRFSFFDIPIFNISYTVYTIMSPRFHPVEE